MSLKKNYLEEHNPNFIKYNIRNIFGSLNWCFAVSVLSYQFQKNRELVPIHPYQKHNVVNLWFYRKLWLRYQNIQKLALQCEAHTTRLARLLLRENASSSWLLRAQTSWPCPRPRSKSLDSSRKNFSNSRRQRTTVSTKPDIKFYRLTSDFVWMQYCNCINLTICLALLSQRHNKILIYL